MNIHYIIAIIPRSGKRLREWREKESPRRRRGLLLQRNPFAHSVQRFALWENKSWSLFLLCGRKSDRQETI